MKWHPTASFLISLLAALIAHSATLAQSTDVAVSAARLQTLQLTSTRPASSAMFVVDGAGSQTVDVYATAPLEHITLTTQGVTTSLAPCALATPSCFELDGGGQGAGQGIPMLWGRNGHTYVFAIPTLPPGVYELGVSAAASAFPSPTTDVGVSVEWRFGSNIQAGIVMQDDVAVVGQPIVISVLLVDAASGVPNAAVEGRILPQGALGGRAALAFHDDGANGDAQANDGVYSATWTPTAAGNFSVTASLTGVANGVSFERDAGAALRVVPRYARLVPATQQSTCGNLDAGGRASVVRISAGIDVFIPSEFLLVATLHTPSGTNVVARGYAAFGVGGSQTITAELAASEVLALGEPLPYMISKLELTALTEEGDVYCGDLGNLAVPTAPCLPQRPNLELSGRFELVPEGIYGVAANIGVYCHTAGEHWYSCFLTHADQDCQARLQKLEGSYPLVASEQEQTITIHNIGYSWSLPDAALGSDGVPGSYVLKRLSLYGPTMNVYKDSLGPSVLTASNLPSWNPIRVDMNGNGIADSCDIASGALNDQNEDGFADGLCRPFIWKRFPVAGGGGYSPVFVTIASKVVSYQDAPFGNTFFEWLPGASGGGQWISTFPAMPYTLDQRECKMVFDTLRNKYVVVGTVINGLVSGFTGVRVWEAAAFDQQVQSVQAIGPTYRREYSLVFDESRGRTIMFGGWAEVAGSWGDLDQIWEWDGQAWSNIPRPASGQGLWPTARHGHRMIYDPVHIRTLLFGGARIDTGAPVASELWSWNGTTWQLLNSGQLPPMETAGMAFDALRSQLVLTGETSTWVFNDASGLFERQSGGLSGGGTNLIYDPTRDEIIGAGGSLCRQIGGSPYITAHPPSRTVGNGSSFSLSVSLDPSIVPTAFQWLKNDQPITAPTSASSINSAALTFSNARSFDEGNYQLKVWHGCGVSKSHVGRVSVYCRNDWDSNGVVEVQDIFAFMSDWFALTPASDYNGDGAFSIQDLFAYLNGWFAGCP